MKSFLLRSLSSFTHIPAQLREAQTELHILPFCQFLLFFKKKISLPPTNAQQKYSIKHNMTICHKQLRDRSESASTFTKRKTTKTRNSDSLLS